MARIVPPGEYAPWHIRNRRDVLRFISNRRAIGLIIKLARRRIARRVASVMPWSALCRFPIVVSVELTNRCDLGCVMCHRNFMERSEGDMDLSVFRTAAEEMGAIHGTMMVFIGQGEPTLHPRFIECLRTAKQAGVERVLLQTNGGKLEAMAAELVAAGLDDLHVSMDGAESSTLELIRKGADAEAITRGVHAVIAARKAAGSSKPAIALRFCTMPRNADERSVFWEQWKDILGEQDEVRFDGLQVYKEAPISDAMAEMPCSILWKRVFIRWNGDYAFCCNHKENRLGIRSSFPDTSIRNMWASKQLDRARTLQLRGRKREIEGCAECPLMAEGLVFDEVVQ